MSAVRILWGWNNYFYKQDERLYNRINNIDLHTFIDCQKKYVFPPSMQWMTQAFVCYESPFVFQTSMSAVCRHTPAGMTVCVWTYQEALTVCASLVQAAAVTAHRKRESDAMGRTGNQLLTAVLYAPARYRGWTHTYKFTTLCDTAQEF